MDKQTIEKWIEESEKDARRLFSLDPPKHKKCIIKKTPKKVELPFKTVLNMLYTISDLQKENIDLIKKNTASVILHRREPRTTLQCECTTCKEMYNRTLTDKFSYCPKCGAKLDNIVIDWI